MASNKLLVLITGANQGLGYYAAAQMASKGTYHILLGSRSLKKAQTAIQTMKSDTSLSSPIDISNISPIEIDMTSDLSIQTAAQKLQETYGDVLDILMLNAGISRAVGIDSDLHVSSYPPKPGEPSLREQYTQQYDTNVFGNAVAIETFLPLLRNSTKAGGKRIAFTGSSTGSITASTRANHTKYYRIYRSSKSAVNMVMASYAHELESEGFVVGASCPGYCATNLNLHKGLKDPREGAKVIVHVATTASKEECHGKLVDADGVVPW